MNWPLTSTIIFFIAIGISPFVIYQFVKLVKETASGKGGKKADKDKTIIKRSILVVLSIIFISGAILLWDYHRNSDIEKIPVNEETPFKLGLNKRNRDNAYEKNTK